MTISFDIPDVPDLPIGAWIAVGLAAWYFVAAWAIRWRVVPPFFGDDGPNLAFMWFMSPPLAFVGVLFFLPGRLMAKFLSPKPKE